MRYQKYSLSAFFEISTTQSVDKNKLVFHENGNYDFIGRTRVNWGIQGRLEKLSFEPNPKNSFSLVQVGETVALWREREWYASQNIFLLKPKFSCVKSHFLYFQCAINKEMSVYGKDYNSYPTIKSLYSTYIYLPSLDALDPNSLYSSEGFIPDFEYMQERIAELEQERIAELEQYLIATGLNDYELTDEDNDILSVCKETKSFRLGDLFRSENGDVDLQKKDINNQGVNVVSSGVSNNGYIGKTDRAAKIISENTLSVDMFGFVFYRDVPYKMVTHARVFALLPLFKEMNECIGQYIVSKLSYLSSIYNYSNMCSWAKIKNSDILLPIQKDINNNPIIDSKYKYHPDGYIPDWEFMEKYIRVIEKIVIADVVRYKDDMIAKTRSVVA